MATVYLPVEVSRREMPARSLLAAALAAKGHDVLVFRGDLFDRVGWPGPGVYIGKNCLNPPPPHDLTSYRRVKAAGIYVWLLDEEGGVFDGSDESEWRRCLYEARFDPLVLASEDAFLTWGDWQKEAINDLRPSASVHAVGSCNFEIYQPRFKSFLEEFDKEQTGGAQDYILINTRFVFANALDNGSTHFIHRSNIKELIPEEGRFNRVVADGITFYQFIGLIRRISRAFPARKVVVRPHPVEEPTTYQRLLGELPNVLVTGSGDAGAWIRRAKCLVHNGCTTAIQAAIAGTPVISYVPDHRQSAHSAALPNEVGVRATTEDQVLSAITNVQLLDRGVWRRTVSSLNTTDQIATMLDGVRADQLKANRRAVERFARRFDRSEIPRVAARYLLPGRRVVAGRRDAKFDVQFFCRLPELVAALGPAFGTRIESKRLSKYCFLVHSGKVRSP